MKDWKCDVAETFSSDFCRRCVREPGSAEAARHFPKKATIEWHAIFGSRADLEAIGKTPRANTYKDQPVLIQQRTL
jgi:hypothetical protein